MLQIVIKPYLRKNLCVGRLITRCVEKNFSNSICKNSWLNASPIEFNANIAKSLFDVRLFHNSSRLNKKDDTNGNEKPQKESSDKKNPSTDNENENEKNDHKMKTIFSKIVLWMFAIYITIMYLSLLFSPKSEKAQISSKYVSWNEFVHHMLSVGEVKELIIRPDMEMVTIILHEGAIVKDRQVNSTIFHMAVADASTFERKLRDVERKLGISEGVAVSYDRHSDVTMKLIITLLLFAILMSFASRLKGFKNPISVDGFNQMGRAKFTLVDPFDGGRGVFFRDVAGLKEAKQEVKEFIDYLKAPEKYQKLGAKVPRGALLLGPPGCGKTLLAKAVATEAQVPFLSMNGSEFVEMIGGLGAARVRDLFNEGKKRAPCIIYIDEIDAIGRQRSSGAFGEQSSSGESEQTLNQLLVEMDGMVSKEGVLMLASTNRPDILDKALLRPGRFDRHILIDLPTLQERLEIFEKYLSNIQLEFEPKKYSERLAKLTPGFSGADIANVCNEAALHAARNSQKIIFTRNLEYAVERLVGGTEKRSHLLTHAERKIIAYHESGHALIGWLLPMTDVLLKVTIVPRTNLALGFAQYAPSEQKLFTKQELFNKMCMALGGKAAENLIFNVSTSGAKDDLEKVTKIAYSQIKKFGMSDVIGSLYIADADENKDGNLFYKPFSNSMDSIIDKEAREIITSAYEKANELLSQNQDKLRKLAETLLEKETLSYEDIVHLIGPPLHDKSKRATEPVDFKDSLNNLAGNS